MTTETRGHHTPGPWAYVYGSKPENEWFVGGVGCLPIVASVYADPDGGLVDGATIEANARLIAAAPELLAALKELIEAGLVISAYSGAIGRAQSAIAKAEGRAP